MRSMKTFRVYFLILIVCAIPSCNLPQINTPIPTVTLESNITEIIPTEITVEKIITVTATTEEPTIPTEPADIIFLNGNVITIEKEIPLAQAVAIRGNLIQAVGSDAEIMLYKGDDTAVFDLQNATLMPGFADGHTHYTRNKWGEGVPIPSLMNDLLAFGLTSITEMHSTDEYINAMRAAEQNGEVDIRVNIFGTYNCGFLENHKSIECTSWYKDNPPILDPNLMVRVPGVKIFMDGAGIPRRGCPFNTFLWPANITDYWPDIWESCGTPYGDLYLTEDQLIPVLQDIQDRGYRAAFHAMGDGTIDVILNSIETVLNGGSNLTYRHQIQHSSTLRPDQVERYVQMDMLASIRGYFNTCEAEVLEAWYGEGYYEYNANRFDLPNLGLHTFNEGDFAGRVDIHKIGVSLNPIWSLYGLVTHQQLRDDYSVCEPPQWIAKHKISVERALEMLTIEPAYAVSMEEYIGSIKPGKFADLIILSDDPLTMDPNDLYKLKVWMTMVNGEIKYCADGQDVYCESQDQETNIPTVEETDQSAVQTVQVKYDCNKNDYSPSHFNDQQFLLTNITWGASTEQQLNDFLEAIQFTITVNGKQIPSSLDHGPFEQSNDGNKFTVLTYFDVGRLQPGEYEIKTVLSFTTKISDGIEFYGPGTKYSTIEGTCSVIID